MAFKRLGRRFYRLGRRSRSNSPAQALSTNIGISADTASITAADTVPASTTATDTAPAGKITIATAPAATTTSLPERLWDQAYDNLKVKEEALIQAYEKILSRVIRGDGIVSQEDESEHNTIEQKNTHARKNQMLQLTYAGLNKTAQQARVKGNLNEAMKAVLTLKDTISIGLQAAPEAALPWAGICVTLQLFTNPLTESKSNRDGIIYVINRMDWYLKLSKLLFKKNTMQGSDISDVQRELETRLVDFYTLLLLYQIKSVCSYYRHGGLVFLRDLVKLDDWDGNLSAIREAENGFNRDTNAYNGQKAVSYIEQLVSYQITEKDQQCIKDLRLTDPRDDKTRIEQTKGGLLQDSFRWILDNSEFQQWRDNDQSRLLWIKGDPGKGKTMLLCGIVDELKKSTTSYSPVSFFFCQATDSHINNVTAVLRGLIYLFIEQQPSLVSHIRKKYDLAGKQLFEGANVWVALSGILTDILHDPALKAAYLIIDALDECVSGLTQLLKLVIQNVSASPHVKWIVSSRNWPSIERQLSLADGAGGVRLSLEVNANIISSAVDTYIEHKVSQLVSIKNDKKLQDQVRLRMCQKANSTFLWVALVFKKLQDLDDAEYEDGSDILKILEAMPSDLTEFYARMIQQIDLLQGDDPERCRTILSIMTLAYRPLNLLELPILAGFNGNLTTTSALGRLVNKCGSFLTVRDGTIYFIHQSAKDYLTTNGSARSVIFPSGSEDAHHTISIRSLKAMHDKLRRNIYALHRPGLLIDEVNAPELDPLTAVQYSCIHWVGHLCEGYANGSTTIYQNDFDDGGVISLFLREHFLHWLEALSLLRNMSDGALSITKLGSLLMEQSPKCELFSFIKDARRFILHNRQVIENAPLQTYSSALIFSPMQSLTRLMFKKDEPRWIKTIPIIESNWSPCLQTLEGHSDSINSVAFSSDSKLVASGSWDSTVKIWDAITGTEVQTLKGHSHWVLSVAFSSDSKLVASGSVDKTVKIWDAVTCTEMQALDVGISLSSISFDTTSSCLLTNIGPIRLNSIKISDTDAKAHDQVPLQPSACHGYGFSSDRAWISCNGNNELWLPPDYRSVVSAVSSLMVAIGYNSGRVITIGFSEPPTP